MSNKKDKPRSIAGKKHLPVPVIVAIIGGVFALTTTILTVVPSWITTLQTSLEERLNITPTPNDLAKLILSSNIPPTELYKSIIISNDQYFGYDSYFERNIDPGLASRVPIEQRIPVTTNNIWLSFDLSNKSTKEWIKVENRIFFRVDEINTISSTDRQNILKGEAQGGLGKNVNFHMYFTGNIQIGDVLESHPSEIADFFTLQPGEVMAFNVETGWKIPPGFYKLTPGIIYSISGNKYMAWFEKPLTILSPSNPQYWEFQDGEWKQVGY